MDIVIVNDVEAEKLRGENGKMLRIFQKFLSTEARICKLIDLPEGKTVKSVYNDVHRRISYAQEKYPGEYPIKVKIRDGIIYLIRTDNS